MKQQDCAVNAQLKVTEDDSAVVISLKVVDIHTKMGRPAGRKSSSALDGVAKALIPKASTRYALQSLMTEVLR